MVKIYKPENKNNVNYSFLIKNFISERDVCLGKNKKKNDGNEKKESNGVSSIIGNYYKEASMKPSKIIK